MGITHITTHLREQWGGMQAMIEAMQRSGDTTIRLFEQDASGRNGELGLGADGLTTLHSLRRAWKQQKCAQPGQLTLYHNAFALGVLADLDRSGRRVIFIHTISPLITASAPKIAPYVDGVLACGDVPLAYMRRLMPDLPEERFFCCQNGVELPDNLPQRAAGKRNPIRLCYAGRLVSAQKRLDRLPSLIAELDRLGVPFEMSIVGDGELTPWLQKQLADDQRVHLTGKLEQQAYWAELARADIAFLLSDFEGASIFQIEAMATGAIPLTSEYDPAVRKMDFAQRDPMLTYPVGDMAALAQRIQRLQQLPSSEFEQLSQDIARLGQVKTITQFSKDTHAALDWLSNAPPIARPIQGRQVSPWDWLPIGLLGRIRREHWNTDRFTIG